MATGRTFRIDLQKWANATQEKLDALVRQTCQEVAYNVVRDTPVDTGFLRGSWQPSIGKPEGAVGKTDPSGAIAAAEVSLVAAQMKAGERFFMINNAKYARFVEYGTSKMAPRYFVTDNVKRFSAIVRKYARQLKVKA